MKNILIYTNLSKKFNEENEVLIKVHIDNSLSLGYHPQDLLLYTNFPYSYRGIKAIDVGDVYCRFDMTSNKILVIRNLLRKGKLKGWYWYHDFDAYENHRIKFEDLKLDSFDLGLTGYGYKQQCNGGSFFFNEKSLDIFELWVAATMKNIRTRADEKSMTDMTYRQNTLDRKRYKYLNITYNFGMRNTGVNYKKADKPVKVLHFHPWYNDAILPYPTLQTFMYGKNPMNRPLMSRRLISIFQKHGIR